MLSGKGIQPSFMPLSSAALEIAKLPIESTVAVNDQSSDQLETAKPLSGSAPLELTTPTFSQKQTKYRIYSWKDMSSHQMGAEEVAAFAAKFKGWRKNDDESDGLIKGDADFE